MTASLPYPYSGAATRPRRSRGVFWYFLLLSAGLLVGAYRNDYLRAAFRAKGKEAVYLKLEAATLGAPGRGTPRELESMIRSLRGEAVPMPSTPSPSETSTRELGVPVAESGFKFPVEEDVTSVDDLAVQPVAPDVQQAADADRPAADAERPLEPAVKERPETPRAAARAAPERPRAAGPSPGAPTRPAVAVTSSARSSAKPAPPPAEPDSGRPKSRKQQLDDAILKAMGQ